MKSSPDQSTFKQTHLLTQFYVLDQTYTEGKATKFHAKDKNK